jgi:DNA-binding MarR family transcriptional regulator
MAREKKARPDEKAVQAVPATAGLGFYLREAYRAFSRDFHGRLARHGVTHAQWVLLWFLSQAGSLTPLELSRRAGIQKASATSVIEALKRQRLIRGDKDSVDRRKLNLHLTPAGVDLMQELIVCAATTNTDARLGLSDKELETLLRLLRGVTANLEPSRGERSKSA